MKKPKNIREFIRHQIQEKVMRTSRKKKLEHFFSLYNEGMTVLDVGVSSEKKKGGLQRNYFLKNFPYLSEYYTGLGIQDLDGMDKLFPGKKFVQYSGDIFPFQDKQFDWVYSNGVIEHVGDEQAQLNFLNEMLRVGKNVFFTTPNKYFPIEAHTQVFFIHWNDNIFDNWKQKNLTYEPKEFLFLLSKKKIRRILERSNASNCKIHNNFPSFYPMTFTVICRCS